MQNDRLVFRISVQRIGGTTKRIFGDNSLPKPGRLKQARHRIAEDPLSSKAGMRWAAFNSHQASVDPFGCIDTIGMPSSKLLL